MLYFVYEFNVFSLEEGVSHLENTVFWACLDLDGFEVMNSYILLKLSFGDAQDVELILEKWCLRPCYNLCSFSGLYASTVDGKYSEGIWGVICLGFEFLAFWVNDFSSFGRSFINRKFFTLTYIIKIIIRRWSRVIGMLI